MKDVIVRVLPWAMFGVGTAVWGNAGGTALAAAGAAMVVAVLAATGMSWRAMILDLTALGYFGVNAVLLAVLGDGPYEDYVAAGSQLCLAAVVITFLVGGLPFTTPLALAAMAPGERDEMSAEPGFHRLMSALTLMWVASFVVAGALLVTLQIVGAAPVGVTVAVISASLAVPLVMQGRMIASAQTRTGTTD